MEHRRFEDEDHAYRYAQARFSYPMDLKQEVLDFLDNSEISGRLGQLVDVGCGSGQSTPLFADHFETLLGVDFSRAQIEEATKRNRYENVRYALNDAYSIPVEDESTDLVTCASAAHWLDIPRFYEEVRRILKPGGVVAIWCYKYPDILLEGDPEASKRASEIVKKIFSVEWVEGGWRAPEALQCDEMYANIPVCFPDSEHRYFTHVNLSRSVNEVVQLFSTFSSYQKLKEAHPNWDYLGEFRTRLLKGLENPDSGENTQLVVKFPTALLLSRKPHQK